MDKSFDTFSHLISDFVCSTPPEIVRSIIAGLTGWDNTNAELSKAKSLSTINNPEIKIGLKKIIDTWQKYYPDMQGISLAISMNSCMATKQNNLPSPIEFVWTGPQTAKVPARRTDQALLQLIGDAKKTLLIVSFAVYKADSIIAAISDAIKRGVRVQICLEDADESNGKVTYSGAKAFDKSIFRMADFYYWPIKKRPHTDSGKHGSLHAKLAVADGQQVFISSANLTEYAMDLNMEAGVLIKNAEMGLRVEKLFDELIIQGVLQKTSIHE